MTNRVSFVLNRTPPYLDTEVPYERTKTEIEILLKSYGIKGIRWTSWEGQDDVLEFVIEAEVQGVKKQLGVSVKPPHIYIKKKLHGKLVNTENINQEYRLLFHWIKSKIEAVVWGLSTIEKEFLSEMTLKAPDGRITTVSEVVIDFIRRNTLESLPFYDNPKQPCRVNETKVIDVEPSKEAP